MKTIRSLTGLSRHLDTLQRQGRAPLVLVPTMGALHDGHAALIRRARSLAGGHGAVAVSVFVNPIQFGPREDLGRYPRPVSDDLALCESLGVDLVFLPSDGAMYRPDHSTFVDESALSAGLCGASRPGHFRGVCTVVAKLLLLFQPDAAVFGEKDLQQLLVIRRMVRDLNLPVRIVAVPTAREADGLALSSRNRLLEPAHRAQAPALRRALLAAAAAIRAGERRPATVRALVRRALAREAPDARLDYLEIVAPADLRPAREIRPPVVLAIAAHLGGVRLIDNLRVTR